MLPKRAGTIDCGRDARGYRRPFFHRSRPQLFSASAINDPFAELGQGWWPTRWVYVRVYWYLGLFPTLVLALTMLSFSFVGDGLRDALDPQLGKR